ncbi:hypothetical protein N7495_004235 [Penicillium taxi]|uniref:uncharacterized protein n=1 Tax=Penicillium taxi TaxID=168475 RepID=UPI002545117B|nr:uncharacterized protein N7495_004235 [Penicillium taxi]KAJ5899491.1 hypothetical protein N7495_004235 [Penicillium taxi]
MEDSLDRTKKVHPGQILAAVQVLCTFNVIISDCGLHNILYNDEEQNPTVCIVDFEYLHVFADSKDPSKDSPVHPEAYSVFKDFKDDEINFDSDEDEDEEDEGEDKDDENEE